MIGTLPAVVLAGVGASAAIVAAPARFAAPIATIAAAIAFVMVASAVPLTSDGGFVVAPFWSTPSLGVVGALKLDGLSIVFALLITGIGALVFLYAGQYMKGDPKLRRLMLILGIFMTAMLGAVLADDIVLLFVFWEITSIASFLLVGLDGAKEDARKSALKALLVTGGGGLALLAGLILVSIAAGTTSLTGVILAQDAVLAHPAAVPAMLLIILGCITKSAQAPFHFWLPAAMAAPTPVSAYLHSATMVKLGVYLLARLDPVYGETPLWEATLTWIGLATAVVGAVLALRETDLKAVLAYTTITALGTLTLLIGLTPDVAATAAVTFLIVHALYKAAFFMLAGIVDHKTGVRDLKRLSGLGAAMPISAGIALLAGFSMAGLPPFVGFVGKELLYESKLEAVIGTEIMLAGGFAANAIMVAIAGVLSIRLFFGERKPTPKTPRDPHWTMYGGPGLLAVLGLVAGAWPSLIGAPLVEAAASSMLFEAAEVRLKLWHGFNLVFMLSLATVTTGLLLYFFWTRVNPTLGGAAAFDRFGPTRWYDDGLKAIVAGCAAAAKRMQHGDLAGYLRTLFLVTAVSVLATLALRGGFSAPAAAAWLDLDARAIAFVLLLIGAAAAAFARSTIAAVIATGLVGFAAALIFLTHGAPDVALTQFAVETLLVAILAAALIRLPLRSRDQRTRQRKWKDGLVALGLGGAVTAALLAVLATPFDRRLSDWFAANSLAEAHGRNVVNVILVDFRALDTLGEIAVLAIAAIAIAALLRAVKPSGSGA